MVAAVLHFCNILSK